MIVEITEDQRELRSEVIRFVENHLNDLNYIDEFSEDMWKAVADFGLFGISISEELGGLGESYLTSAIISEALGYACINNGFLFSVNVHTWVVLNLIALYGSDLLKEKYLPSLLTGEAIGAFAITEAESGSDAMSMKAMAVEVEDGYRLNANKMFISNGPIADRFIVFAMTNRDKNFLTAFVVERDFPGVSTGPDIKKMGLNACPTSELILDNVLVPKENILGRKHSGALVMTNALEWERCYEFAPHVGAMERMMEKSIEQAKARSQFGKLIEEYQSVSHKIADMAKNIEFSRLMLYHIASLKDQNKSAFLETAMFKTFVSEAYIKTCKDAMQIHGAYGYTEEYGLERELRDALASSIYSGTNEMQRNTIYNMISGQFIRR